MSHNTGPIVVLDFANFDGAMTLLKKGKNLPQSVKVDLEKLIFALTLGSTIVSKSIYLERKQILDAEASKKQDGFTFYLKKAGFNVVTKEMKTINLPGGNQRNKNNFDVEIAVDVCRHIWRRDCNEIILISGDSDFAYLLKEAKKTGIKTTVVSTAATVSRELRECSDRLIILDDLEIEHFLLARSAPLAHAA